METLKVWYTDFWPEWPMENFVQPILEKHYNVVVDQKNPDVLFHSIFNRMQDTPKYKCKKVLILAENWRPSKFGSDYSISFDPHSETNFRLPLWQIYLLLWPKLKDQLFNRVHHENFERFCSFTVSNGGNFMRNSAFQQLSQYKRVHSYGRFMNNDMGLQKASEGRYWRDAKDEFFMEHPHKFMMAYENKPYPWYCTEKLMDAFLVGSIPIYWGDPKVDEDWNEKAFINAGRHQGMAFDIIKMLDKNESMFNDMYNEPVFTEEQKKKHLENLENFETWLIEKVK
jgi:alpha(1,3/1,4) fucosyltransferase